MKTLPETTSLDAGLPSAVEAERTVLGAVLLDNECWLQIEAKLRPDDFSLDSHKRIGSAMKRLRESGSAIDIITLGEYLKNTKGVDAVGGFSYLASLTEGLPLRPAIDDYVRILKDKSVLRQVMLSCSAAIARAQDQSESGLSILSDLAGQVEAMAEPMKESNAGPLRNFIVEAQINFQREYTERITPCIPSGIDWLDRKAGGYRLGRISLVGARPNVGKTPWGIQSLAHACMNGRRGVFFSLEQDKEEALRSFLPWVTTLPARVCSRPELQTAEQNAEAGRGFEALLDWDLHIYDGEMDAEQICWVMDRETRDEKQVLFVLDHFGKIAGGNVKDTRARYNENSERLRKNIKKKKNAALLELCQLRKVNREFWNKPPIPDDLKETGNLYEDAYLAILIHRAISEDDQRMSKDALINLCKLRAGGSTGSTTGKFSTRRLEFITQAELEMPQDDEDYFA
ncbi:MAG: hypothetical protein KGL39_36310 [Patescibacteria group bacterium]|nr:hypothetical protein [Patescibacteria group bacterium]